LYKVNRQGKDRAIVTADCLVIHEVSIRFLPKCVTFLPT